MEITNTIDSKNSRDDSADMMKAYSIYRRVYVINRNGDLSVFDFDV